MPSATQPPQKPPTPNINQPEEILHDLEEKKPMTKRNKKFILGLATILVIFAGSLTGYLLSRQNQEFSTTESGMPGFVNVTGTEEGSTDKETFKDTTEGILKKGGLDGEGTHHLIRGDESQTAYLTSSVIDLDKYANMKVQVWGETFAAQKAGWFMDVGRIKVLDNNPKND